MKWDSNFLILSFIQTIRSVAWLVPLLPMFYLLSTAPLKVCVVSYSLLVQSFHRGCIDGLLYSQCFQAAVEAFKKRFADSTVHNVCEGCNIDFPTWNSLKEHWVQNPRHSYCQYCNRHLKNEYDLISHYEDMHDYCSTCHKVFRNEYGLKEHFRQSPIHLCHSPYHCVPCNRYFASASNLEEVSLPPLIIVAVVSLKTHVSASRFSRSYSVCSTG
jgi:hypothetical protein